MISNNALATSSSNGRTLLGLLGGIRPENLAQFYVTGADPDVTAAGFYFRMTDREALRFSLMGAQPGGRVEPALKASDQAPISIPRTKRTPLKMLAREVVWWVAVTRRPRRLHAFLDGFSPDVVIAQAGDAAFILRLAGRMAERLQIPLVLFNSEDYYFKTHNYLGGNLFQNFVYRLWHNLLRRVIRRTFTQASHVIYSCDELHESFRSALGTESSTIFTPSSIEPRSAPHRDTPHTFVYAGNLGLGRLESLIEIAEQLALVAPATRLIVYGPTLDPANSARACSASHLDFRGFASYEQVIEQLRTADVTVHVESFDPAIRRDTKHAFSTKLADCLASGTPLLLYAPSEIASTKYVAHHAAAFVATSKRDLPGALRASLDREARRRVSAAAKDLAARNHDPASNRAAVADILESAVRCEHVGD